MLAPASSSGAIAPLGDVISDVTPGPWPAMSDEPCATMPMLTAPVR